MASKNPSIRTKSGKIVRALMTVTGKGTHLFNDKTKDGRSIKVKGWKRDHYEVAMEALIKQGIPCKLVTTPGTRYCGIYYPGAMRIHTQESA